MGDRGYLGLPQLPQDDFNRLMRKEFGEQAPVWNDADSNGIMEPGEITTKERSDLSRYVTVRNAQKAFTTTFREGYASAVERFRREAITRELTLTYREAVKTDLDAWLKRYSDATPAQIQAYKNGVGELLRFGDVMKRLYQRQVGFSGELLAEPRSAEDEEMISRYGHPWCMGDLSPFCVALPSLAPRGSGIYPEGISCEDAQGGYLSLGNPFSIVDYDENGFLRPVPFAVAFREEQHEAAAYLRSAAQSLEAIPREVVFAKHLRAVAAALESNKPFPYVEADRTWHEHGVSDSIFFFRGGPDEVGGDHVGDMCEQKARFHLNLGLVNVEASRMTDQYRPQVQKWENRFAELVGNPELYQAQMVALTMPQFFDVIFQVGDDVGGPNGTNIGQTLPNWCGEDGELEPCSRRIMIYVNKTDRAYSEKIMQRYIRPLFAQQHHAEFTTQGGVGLKSVILHEIAHNFGPQIGKPKPGSDSTYDANLGRWRGTMEELKAQTGSLFLAGELLREARAKHDAGQLTDTQLAEAEAEYRHHILYDMGWAMRMVLRAVRTSGGTKLEGGPYSKLAAIQVGFLREQGALVYDEAKGEWSVRFEGDRMLTAVDAMMTEVLRQYANADLESVDAFAGSYVYGEKFHLLETQRLIEVAGQMPSVLFDYEIEGLGSSRDSSTAPYGRPIMRQK